VKRRLAAFVIALSAAGASLGIGAQAASAAQNASAQKSVTCLVVLSWSICLPSLFQ
jgi:hypothetical protein